MASMTGQTPQGPSRRLDKTGLSRGSRPTLTSYLASRRKRPYTNVNIADISRNHEPFLYRMDFMKKLPVHTGCVNTICWNKSGEYILSGSDDCNLCITKPNYMFDKSQDYTVLHKVPTKHLGNIFCARFIPNSGDLQIISCSSDGPVMLHDLCSTDPSDPVLSFNCHGSTIYEVAPVADDDKIFLSCSEDRTVRLFDTRVHSSCSRAGTCPHPALIKSTLPITTLCLHPLNTNLMLVGRADGVGLVYDRRKLPDVAKFSRERAHIEWLTGAESQCVKERFKFGGAVAQFVQPADADDKYRFTSLCYNENGTEVLASYSSDYIYLFSHDRSSNMELIQTITKRTGLVHNAEQPRASRAASEGASSTRAHGSSPARISRIRVRGDWSDTGANSVPFSQMARDGQQHGSAANDDGPQDSDRVAITLGNREFRNSGHSLFMNRYVNFNLRREPAQQPLASDDTSQDHPATSQTNSNSSDPHRAVRSERTIEEEDEGNQEDNDDEDGNSTVIDDDDSVHMDEIMPSNNDEDDEDDEDDDESNAAELDNEALFERFAKRTVEALIDEAQHHQNQGGSGSSGSSSGRDDEDEAAASRSGDHANSRRSRKGGKKQERVISPNARDKFREMLDGLKNKYQHLPKYKPRIRYQGHRNSRTSIKEAIFWGNNYIISGSDCGRIMVWRKETAELVMAFPADERVVNCLAPNPQQYVLASSGIDYDIKLWSTQGLDSCPLRVCEEELKKIIENNEIMLEESKHTISVPPHLFFRVLASLVSQR